METKDRVYATILDYLIGHAGQPPTMRQIMETCDISSVSVVNHHVESLISEGQLVKILDDEKLTRNVTIPGGFWLPPLLTTIQWDITKIPIVDDTSLYFLRYSDDDISFSTSIVEIASRLVTKIALDAPQDSSLHNMVRLPAWINDRLEADGYVTSAQALIAGVLPSGKAPTDQGTRI